MKKSSVYKHTRGPWHVYSHRGSNTISIYDYRNHTKKTVIQWTGFDGNYINRFDKNLANARLIAAAPEMLEALEEAAHTFHVSLGFEQQTRKLNKLIAKIKGQT